MNILDAIILICFIPAIIQGIRKGFIAQVIAIVSIVAGIWLSFKFSNLIASWLGNYIQASGNVLHIVAFALILILVILGLAAIGKLIEATIKIVMLGWLNKLLGVVFALLKVVLVIGLFILLFDSVTTALEIDCSKTISESLFYTPIKDFADVFFPYMKELIFNK